MRYLQHHITSAVSYYLEVLQEAFIDINDYLDSLLESELGHNFLIAIIIAAPFIGSYIFLQVLMISW